MIDCTFTEAEIRTFKELFAKFCRKAIKEGRCSWEDTCEFCDINKACEEIFDSFPEVTEDE